MSSGFFSTRGRALKFPAVGTSHVLHISQPTEEEQQVEDGKLLWWDANQTRPRMQAIVSGYVELPDGMTSDDDGFRSLYIRAGIQRAVGVACRKAGVREPGFGMILTITYTHDGRQPDAAKKPPKEYSAALEVVPDAEGDPRFQAPAGRSIPAARGIVSDR
jgi:hypothetical protein